MLIKRRSFSITCV